MCICIIQIFEKFTFVEIDILFFSFGFLGMHPWHMEVPRLGVKPRAAMRTPTYSFNFFKKLFCMCLFRSHLRHMEVPRLGVESEL